MSDYTLMEYTLNGMTLVTAVHFYDLGSFLKEYPDAKVFQK